jgi:hypothetical protein
MRKSKLIFGLLMLISVNVMAEKKLSIASPDQQIQLHFVNADNGSIQYQVNYKSRSVVAPSSLGFRLSEPVISLMNFDVLSVDSSLVNNSWEPVWGEQKTIVNHYRELKIALSDRSKDKIRMDLIFRVYNDGVVFRYEFPVQPNLMHFIVADEISQINMTGDHQAFWIPGDYDTNEYSYYNSALSKIDASGGTFAQEIHAKTFFDSNAVQTPLIMKSKEGIYINIHEAALSNYPAMNLILNKKLLVSSHTSYPMQWATKPIYKHRQKRPGVRSCSVIKRPHCLHQKQY